MSELKLPHRYADGYEAVKADNWCIQCFKAEPEPDQAMCKACGEKRNLRSKRRNEARPTTRRTRKKFLGLLG